MARSSRHSEKKSSPLRRAIVRIDEIGAGGDGVATLDGARVFVPLTAPGDVAEIEARGDRGSVLELKDKSPHRIDAPCRHYGACGGCALQHVTHEYYRGWKLKRVNDALSREGVDDVEVAEIIEIAPSSRRRAVFSFSMAQTRATLGFNARRSSEVTETPDCIVLHPALKSKLPQLRDLSVKMGAPRFDLSVTLCDNGLDIAIAGKGVSEPRGGALTSLLAAMREAGVVRLSLNGAELGIFEQPVTRFGDIAVTPPPGGFLQASREGEAALISLVRQAASGSRKIADLFSGCGTFSLPLAQDATVFAVDSDRLAIEALSRAAREAQSRGPKVNPIRSETRDLYERPMTSKELGGFDAIVFDPPRAGAAAQSAQIAGSGVKTVIGVSCNPVTFARDAAVLKAGGYALAKATLVDQFAYSPHVELVGVFERG